MPDQPSHDPFSHTHAVNLLRLLQQNSRADLPTLIAQRATNNFNLQRESEPQAATSQVFVVVYPQNPFVGEPEVRRMNAEDIQPGLINDRVQIQDSRGSNAQPDEMGNYLFWPGSIEFDQVSAFYYSTYTLRMMERYARRVIPWSFPAARITIDPHMGDRANAFYNEPDRLLGFHSYRDAAGKEASTAQSADIVSHEAAHAVLDGLRDLYNESFGLGARAFHESFGDMTAVLIALHDDSLVRRLLDWSKGNLRMSSFVSEVAEHLAKALQDGELRDENTLYLRNAFNTLTWKPFDELKFLPADPETELGRQEHNYSRLFTGAFYDALVGIYEHFKKTSPALIALHRARDIMGHLLICAVELGPVGEFDFGDMARAFLSADHCLFDGQYRDILRAVFQQRGILDSAAAEAHLNTLTTLPELSLPESVNHALAAALFLERELLPALKLKPESELIPLSTYRNADGSVFMSYAMSRKMKLSGPQYRQFDGSAMDIFGGLTLMFNNKNRLRSVFYRPVTDEDVRQIQLQTAEFIHYGQIVEHLRAQDLSHFRPSPQGLWIPPGFRTEARLVKFPVIYDEVPDSGPNLLDYLRAWLSI